MSPHICGGTEIYNQRAVAIFCENLRRYLARRTPPQRGRPRPRLLTDRSHPEILPVILGAHSRHPERNLVILSASEGSTPSTSPAPPRGHLRAVSKPSRFPHPASHFPPGSSQTSVAIRSRVRLAAAHQLRLPVPHDDDRRLAAPCCSCSPSPGSTRPTPAARATSPGARPRQLRVPHQDVARLAVLAGDRHRLRRLVVRAVRDDRLVLRVVDRRPDVVRHAAVDRHARPQPRDLLARSDRVQRHARPRDERPPRLDEQPRRRRGRAPCTVAGTTTRSPRRMPPRRRRLLPHVLRRESPARTVLAQLQPVLAPHLRRKREHHRVRLVVRLQRRTAASRGGSAARSARRSPAAARRPPPAPPPPSRSAARTCCRACPSSSSRACAGRRPAIGAGAPPAAPRASPRRGPAAPARGSCRR